MVDNDFFGKGNTNRLTGLVTMFHLLFKMFQNEWIPSIATRNLTVMNWWVQPV